MRNQTHSWIILLIGVGLTLILAGLSPILLAYAQDATPEALPEATIDATIEVTAEATTGAILYDTEPPPQITGDNSYCMVCHNRPWKSVTLGDGTIQNLYVDPDTIHASVHGVDSPSGELGCVDCHGDDSFPHNNPSPADARAYAIYAVALCGSCHADEVDELQHGLHEQAILAGNTAAAVCTDCHGSHAIQPVVEQPQLIAGVCGDCHDNTLAEWQVSEHVDIGPLGCATCHSPHSQHLRAGNTSDELCINCHDSEGDRFIHEQHSASESPVACVDCHMYTGEHNARPEAVSVSTFDRSTGHSMDMDATPCTTCHEALVVSGEWAQLAGDREVAAVPIEVPAEAVEGELEVAVAESAQTSYIPLIQGLVLGLGFGVTFAAVFIVRGNRAANRAERHDESAEIDEAPPLTPSPAPPPVPSSPAPSQPSEDSSIEDKS